MVATRFSLRPLMLLIAVGVLTLSATAILPAEGAPLLQVTPTGIYAEAIGEANLRDGPGLENLVVGTITRGTRYPVLGRHALYPWLLLEYPLAPEGVAWVYIDLVSLNVSPASVPHVTGVLPRPDSGAPSLTPSPTLTPDSAVAPPPTLTPVPASAVTMQTEAEVNVRFGPGVEYPRIGRILPGERYTVISRHALFPWILIELPEAPDGVGWVFADVVDITGDLYSLPIITAETIAWPTLTPTPPFVVTSMPPWNQDGDPPTDPLPTRVDMTALGGQILDYLLGLGFVPEEDSFGSVFVLDPRTGENLSLGANIAYSGMSLVKIPILVEYYRRANRPPDPYEAEVIANTMICSGNHTANDLLAIIGGGDAFDGAQRVTEMLHQLGLHNAFVLAPFKLGDAPVEFRPIASLTTPADQTRAAPDPFNQFTPEDYGWLLGAVYQCAMDESGPLFDVFPGEFTATECRQIILAMSRNQINVLTEAGVPVGTRVAHKHGWIDDTHGDASIVFTPGGDFVLVMALYNRDWLFYERSWPAMAEIARMVYNAYNPDQPLDAIHPATVDETCNMAGSPLLAELQQSILPPLQDTG